MGAERKGSTMNGTKVSAREMQNVNYEVTQVMVSIRALGKVLSTGADDYSPDKMYKENDANPNELMNLAANALFSFADKLESVAETADNAAANGCVGTFEGVESE